MPLISIVIPVYNAELFLNYSLQSIINQTFTDWECLVINDGSTDDSLNIITNYANKDNRIRCITIPHGGNASIPRAKGVKEALGKWIVYFDADDALSSDYLSKMVSKSLEFDVDILLGRMVMYDSTLNNIDNNSIPNVSFDMHQIMNGIDAFLLTIGDWIIGCNGMMVKANLFKSHLKEGNYINSDELNSRILLYYARKVAFCDVNYNYRIVDSSITHKISTKLYERLFVDAQLEEFIAQKFNRDSSISQRIRKVRFDAILYWQQEYWETRRKYSKTERIKIFKIIKENYNTQDRRSLKIEFDSHSRFWKMAYLSNYLFFYLSSTFGHSYLKKIGLYLKKII